MGGCQLTPCCCCCRWSCCLNTRPNPDTGEGRRRILDEKLKTKLREKVECFREYVELPDGHLQYTTCWAPKPKSKIAVKGLICFAEGYADCVDYLLEETYVRLSELGYVVFSWDNLGQGRSDGLWNYIDSWEMFINNAAFVIRKVAFETYCEKYNLKHPSQCFLGGHSMGGAYAVELSKKMKDDFAGMVLVAPMCRIDDNILPPDCVVSCLKYCILPCCPAANLTPTDDINAWLTSDPVVKEQVEAHPLLYDHNPRLQTGIELLQATIVIGEEVDKVVMPFLILHGTGDKVTDPKFSQFFFDNTSSVPSDKKRIITYPDAWHMLFDEPQTKKQIYEDIDQWIQSVIGNVGLSEKKEEELVVQTTVVCGPSGVGKGTLIARLKEKFPSRFHSTISHTTRAPRAGEADGTHYHFVSKEKFKSMLAADEFFEYAQVHDNYYGTANNALSQISSKNQIALLEIDVNGAQQIKKNPLGKHAKFLFVSTSGGIDTLKERLEHRATETQEQVDNRMKTAATELDFLDKNPNFFDKLLINDDMDKACQEMFDTFVSWYPSLKSS